jgi:peptide/nickel transport system permease protein
MRLLFFVLRRLLQLIPVLLGVSLITFTTARMLPGNAAIMAAGPLASPEDVARLEAHMKLDRPIWEQYVAYLNDILHGDFGKSWRTGRPVTTELMEHFPASFELVTFSLFLAILIGIPLGVAAAIRQGSRLDQLLRTVSVAGISIPIFWSGLVAIFVFYYLWGIAPAPIGRIGFSVRPPDHVTGFYILDSILTLNGPALASSLRQITLPALSLIIAMMSPIIRITRSSMLDVLKEDYVRSAKASGLRRRVILYRDALRNALLPVITLIGGYYGYSLGGEVLVEQIFSWPGMGRYSVEAIFNLDYAPVQGFVMLTALLYVLIYTVVDILYAFIDPRIRY